MSLITREGKGSRLTIQEMDGNLLYLEELANLAGDNIKYGNTLFVDTVYGNNETATPNSSLKPYSTISEALNSAVEGDCIILNTGIYNEQIILKNNIDIYCFPNTTLNSGIVDNGTSVTCKVLGKPNINGFRAIYLTGQNSNVYIEANDVSGSFDTIVVIGTLSSGELTLNLHCNNIRAFGQFLLYCDGGYCNVNIKADIIENVTSAFSVLGNMIGTLNMEFNKGTNNTTGNNRVFLIAESPSTSLCKVNMKFNEIIDNNLTLPNNVHRGVITSFGNAQLNINGNITSTGARAGIATSALRPDCKIIYSGIIKTRGRECIINGNDGKLILNNTTLIREKTDASNTNYIITEGSTGGMFSAQNNNLLMELNNTKMILLDTNGGTGPNSTTPLMFFTGANSYRLIKDSTIYPITPNPETTSSMDSSVGGGNVFFINTNSSLDKSINITELNTNPGYFFETNFKSIN
jgi:hypothetical protein